MANASTLKRSKFYIQNYVHKQPITVNGLNFEFLQDLKPELDCNNCVITEKPQCRYAKKKSSSYCRGVTANTEFCRFSINSCLENKPGVYLWIVNGEIIYIGETRKIKDRFNSGYGKISPRNCFVGGQATNCKMNNVVLELYRQGKTVSIYFLESKEHKKIEKDLLNRIATQYNVKNN